MPSYQQKYHRSIQDGFEKFHAENPQVYEAFCKLVLAVIKSRGLTTRLSAKHVIGKMRWDMFVVGKATPGQAVNDAYTSRYSRLFQKQYPDYAKIFNNKTLRS